MSSLYPARHRSARGATFRSSAALIAVVAGGCASTGVAAPSAKEPTPIVLTTDAKASFCAAVASLASAKTDDRDDSAASYNEAAALFDESADVTPDENPSQKAAQSYLRALSSSSRLALVATVEADDKQLSSARARIDDGLQRFEACSQSS